MYRKTRRNRSKDEFSKYIGVKQIWMNENIDSFRFMNTGDIIWLNTYKNDLRVKRYSVKYTL